MSIIAGNTRTDCYRLVSVLLIIFFAGFYLQAQEKQYMFTSLNSNQGLSNNRVLCFLRDSKGFIWMGTADGLNRYDGYSFKSFKNDQEDPASIRNSSIATLAEDYNGKIWIGAGVYIEILDPETETITHIDSLFNGKLKFETGSTWKLHKDKFGNYWFLSSLQGLFKYIVTKDSLIKLLDVRQVNNSYRENYQITDFSEETNGDLWAIDNRGLIRKIDHKTNKVADSIRLERKVSNFFHIFIDKDDDIWALNLLSASGAIYINSKTGKIEYINSSSRYHLNNDIVTGYEQDSEGKIWVTTDHGGINIIDKHDFSIQNLKNNPLNERSIAQDVVISIYKDYQDIIWLGTFKKGISYYHEELYPFSHYKIPLLTDNPSEINDIDNFAEDNHGNLWIGTNGGGLVYLDRNKNRYTIFKNEPSKANSLSSNIIIGLTIDSKNNLWVGTYFGGLNKWNGTGFTHYRSNPDDPFSLTDDRIWDICEASDGLLWIATLLGGVNIFDSNTGKVVKVFRSAGDSSIRAEIVLTIIRDSKDRMWFATTSGIRSYNLVTKKFAYYETDPENPNSISDNFVFDVMEDSRGLIWAATSNGLNMLDESTGKFQRLFVKDGLPANRILTVIEDDNKNIWVSTSNGLSKIIINPDEKENEYTFSFKNYNRFDGLQDDNFNDKAVFKTRGGELIFGGGNGFNIFNPNEIISENIEPDIVFTDFLVFNVSYNQWNGKEIIGKSITYTDEVNLEYSQNVFTIEFSNLNYFHPERQNYQYKLEHFNEDWIQATANERKVTYTNLDPGTYIFRVRVANNDGTWNQKEAQLKLVIYPPYWKTWWFRIALIIFFLFIIILIFYWRLRSLTLQKKELEMAVAERTSELSEMNTILEERQEEIGLQNEELNHHRYELQELVEKRTVDLEIALQKAEESDKLKSAFLANMSHEIRTPMNAIIGFSNLLKEEGITQEERNRFINIIEKNCDSLLVIINDILDISMIESDKLTIKKKPFDLIKVFNEMHNFYILKKKKEVSINCDLPTGLKELYINQDETRLRQILQNLMDNALKFTDKGSIDFGFTINNDQINLFVKDTGLGIKAEDQDKVFRPFGKIENDPNRIFTGTGLGLAICRKLIELMQGEISFESVAGTGTVFRVSIPVEIVGKPGKLLNNKEESENVRRVHDILVAEDDPTNYYLIEKILSKSNFAITWAKNGQEAIDYVKSQPTKYAVILMDIKMPVVDGIEAFQKIHEINSSIPVVAVTAYAYASEKARILKNKFAGYISKPLKPKELLNTIETIIGHKTT
jgi:signal transduction histidine kinase/ligand-binding sensor domain-containing protein/ActR/RegA family two-component response regulator